MFTITTPPINEETAEAFKVMNHTMASGVIANSQDGDGYELRPVPKDVAKPIPQKNEQMAGGELETCESVIRTTMEPSREIQRRSELDKEGKLIKDNLKGAIHREKIEKHESSDEEGKRGRKTARPNMIRKDYKRT